MILKELQVFLVIFLSKKIIYYTIINHISTVVVIEKIGFFQVIDRRFFPSTEKPDSLAETEEMATVFDFELNCERKDGNETGEGDNCDVN